MNNNRPASLKTPSSKDISRDASMSRFRVESVPQSDTPDTQAPGADSKARSCPTTPPDLSGADLQQNGVDSQVEVSTPASNSETPSNGEKRGKFVKFSVGRADDLNSSPSVEAYDDMDHRQSVTSGAPTNVKSFRHHMTVDKPPHIDYYRNLNSLAGAAAERSRPTLQELHSMGNDGGGPELMSRPSTDVELANSLVKDQSPVLSPVNKADAALPATKTSGPKFGWITGVLVRCILNILGVMLYLRISWVVGQAGIGFGTLIILLSTIVVVITTLSMCAICTNGEVKGGGAYFMLSRSLGPEFGGSIGIIFSFANAVAVAMYIVGFSETLVDLMKGHGAKIVDSGMNDIRIIGVCTLFLLLGVTLVGMEWEAKLQLVLLVILGISILDYYIGAFIPSSSKQAKGILGFSGAIFQENFLPRFSPGESFFSVFAVFFPAATGILAGANISGDLLNPQHAIPKGTIIAIGITSIIYLSFVWICGSSVLRDASGMFDDVLTGNISDCGNSCAFGLLNYYQIIEAQSGWGPLVTAGIFAATLSSALASLVSAPKVFQAVCNDKLFPFIQVFGKGFGKGNEPRRAYVLAFGIALAMILIGELNAIAPIISNFFLAAYALINFACFDASLANSPGFRPSFQYYNMWISLLGAILCIVVMFVISWWTALLTFAFIATFYLVLHHRKLEVNWGSSTQAHAYRTALSAMLKNVTIEDHVKNYRPQVLILCGNPVARPSLVDFSVNITKDNSLLLCGHVILERKVQHLHLDLARLRKQKEDWLRKRKVKGFYCPTVQPTLRSGAVSLVQLAGLGKLRPNTVLMGFKNNWTSSPIDEVNEYVGIIHDMFDLNLSMCILRVARGLDFSDLLNEHNIEEFQRNLHLPVTESRVAMSRDVSTTDFQAYHEVSSSASGIEKTATADSSRSSSPLPFEPIFTPELHHEILEHVDPTSDMEGGENDLEVIVDEQGEHHLLRPTKGNLDESEVDYFKYRALRPSANFMRRMSRAQKEVVASLNEFQRKMKKGVIDVYWLFDDGGNSWKFSRNGINLNIDTWKNLTKQLDDIQSVVRQLDDYMAPTPYPASCTMPGQDHRITGPPPLNSGQPSTPLIVSHRFPKNMGR